jgi:hypothetical protein
MTDDAEKDEMNAIARNASNALFSKTIANFACAEVPTLLHRIHSSSPTSRAHIT